MAILFGYICCLLIGLTLGLLGGGGSILTVPVLHYLFQMDDRTATASSLAVVGITSAIGAVGAARKGEVAFKKGVIFALPALLAVALTRRFLVPVLPENMVFFELTLHRSSMVMIFFSTIMALAARSMLMPRKNTQDIPSSLNFFSITTQGLWVGVVTGLVGAGGGFLIVPALNLLLQMPLKMAVGTSLFVIALNSLVGFGFSVGPQVALDWGVLSAVCLLSLLGLWLGQRWQNRVSQSHLKKMFAYFILCLAAVILVQECVWIFTHGWAVS